MSVIQFPKSEDARLGDLLGRAGEQLNSEAPPEWVKLQLRAHVARSATAATAPRLASAPVQLATAQSGTVSGGVSGDVTGDFGLGGPFDAKAWGIALIGVIALVGLWIGSGSTRLGGAVDSSPATHLSNGLNQAEDEFVPVVTPQRWKQIAPDTQGQGGAAARAWVVAAEVPAAQLARFGLPFDPAHAGDAVRAELLLHSSGEILAVRLEH